MAVVTDKFIFAHIPKTGGQFVRDVINQLNIKHDEVGEYHAMPNAVFRTGVILPSLITIRHPVTWYQSRWYHRIRHGWSPQHHVDWACANNDFNKFVLNVIEYDPYGRLSSLVKGFTEIKPKFKDNIQYIIKNENLTNELYLFLSNIGETVDRNKYFNINRVNVSGKNGKSSSDVAIYDKDVLEKLLKHESWIIDNYYNGITDPNSLIDQFVL